MTRAVVGDRLVFPARDGMPGRTAEVLEARGPGGGPPYLVRWSETGLVELAEGGSDVHVEAFDVEPASERE